MGIKTIFLDIDGVLNTFYTEEITSTGAIFVDDDKIAILKDIVDKTGAKVVLSSTWRLGWAYDSLGSVDNSLVSDFNELKEKLEEWGIPIHDRTPILERGMRRRGKEIALYLKNHPEVEDYVILDDLDPIYLEPCEGHLVQTYIHDGLQYGDIDRVLKVLGGNLYE